MKTKTRFLMACVGTATALLLASTARSEPQDLGAVIRALRHGGFVLVVRHGATDPSQSDVYPLDYQDMKKQRQLSEQGRETAKQVGAAFARLGVPIGVVYTSRLNRAIETGKLMGGKDVVAKEDLNDSGMGSASAMAGASGGGSESHGRALRTIAASPPPAGTNALIVTHKTNIQDAFGKDWADVREGEASVFRVDESGKLTLVARVQAADWIAAKAPAGT